MRLREDLETIIAGSNDWRDECLARDVRYFLRAHGQALLEALVDAERYKHLRDGPTEIIVISDA